MEKVRYGIVGIGNMGKSHMNWLFNGDVPNAELTAVCDINPERLEFARGVCGDKVAYYDDYHEMIKSGLVDAVLIATPHYLHPVIGIEAFEHGLHVMSEKPIGVYTKQAEEFIAAAEKSGKAFGAMFCLRTEKTYQKMREMVQSGLLGELKRCIWIITTWYRTQSYYNSGGWRATWAGEGGGVLMNQCPHTLDLWQWIFGMPCEVYANCEFGKYHDIEVEDEVNAMVKYSNGATGMFITTTGENPGTNRLEITGSKGKLVLQDGKITYTKLEIDERQFTMGTTEGFGKIPTSTEIVKVDEEKPSMHVGILKNFTNHILFGEELLAPGVEGINALSLANAMLLSTWKGGWIKLPMDGDEYWNYLSEKIKTSKAKETDANVVMDLSGSFSGGSK